jgi:hypothetical protein
VGELSFLLLEGVLTKNKSCCIMLVGWNEILHNILRYLTAAPIIMATMITTYR